MTPSDDDDNLPTATSAGRGAPGRPGSSSREGSDSFDHGRFAPGTILGDRYRIVARLGVGGMGEVFRADDLTLGQSVALKFLPEAFERDRDRMDRFTAEVRTARQISHPNVCRVYDVGEVDGRRFLTMEYVDGEDLRSLLRRIGRLPEDKGLDIARQICAGLAAIHDRGVLHRDLKPANIMLDGRGRVRLTDFGLATAVVGAGTDGEIAGTPAYMAPEQLAGRTLSTATDLYALGLVLFELFTGERLQKSDDPMVVRDAQRTSASAAAATSGTLSGSGSVSKLDPIVQRVIARCLDLDPQRRPQSAIVVAAALPGGDPLAAALAAGETPSPQMVAAAGEEGGLSFTVAVPLLVALVLGVALTAWPGRSSYTTLVTFPHSPEVLASKAGEMLGRLGYTDAPVGQASGFRYDLGAYQKWLDAHDTSASRWQQVATVRPALLRFWYRTSPSDLVATGFFTGSPGGGLTVDRDDPSLTVPGMTYLELNPAGQLVALDVVPPLSVEPAAVVPTPDWAALFREAGLDLAAFAPATPEWVSRFESDASAAWVGPGADASGAPLRVEAAAFGGRPVFFRQFGPWHVPVTTTNANAGQQTLVQRVVTWVVVTVMVVVIVGAFVLSMRNLQLGRTDTRGAMRLGVATGAVVFAAGLLSTDFVGDFSWIFVSIMLLSWAGFAGLLSWTFYASIEPYVRRRWPQMLISWSRLVDGRWRDPLVGRDLLIGSVLGVALQHLQAVVPLLSQWSGMPPTLDTSFLEGWFGLHLVAAGALAAVPTSVWSGLAIVVLLVVLRLVLRREWVAALVVVLIFAAPEVVMIVNPVAAVAIAVIRATVMVVVATRFGLVMFIAILLMPSLTRFVGSYSDPDFATGAMTLAMMLAVSPGVFGFFTATRGRKAGAWLEE